MRWLDTILEIVFPVYCISCGKKGSDLCLACLSLAPEAERESANWIFPLFDYRHPPTKKAVWLIKYKGKKRLIRVFAEILHGRILEELSELSVMQNFREPLLIPIPLSNKRYRERGFNQAELLSREIVKMNGGRKSLSGVSRRVTTREAALGEHAETATPRKDFPDEVTTNILIKIKETEHQARIRNRSDRLKNLSGSFAVKNPELIKNRNIILIDDVTTTGATLSEARKILKQAGARKVIAFTIAH